MFLILGEGVHGTPCAERRVSCASAVVSQRGPSGAIAVGWAVPTDHPSAGAKLENLMVSKAGRAGQRLLDIVRLQIRVGFQYRLPGFAGSQKPKQPRYREPQPPNRGLTPQTLGSTVMRWNVIIAVLLFFV